MGERDGGSVGDGDGGSGRGSDGGSVGDGDGDGGSPPMGEPTLPARFYS